MTQCTLCREKITTKNYSREHIVPQSIGGRAKVGGFICKACNNRTGAEWDRPLFDQYHWLSLVLGISRESGTLPPALTVKTEDGRDFKMSSDGGLSLAKPVISSSPESGAIAFTARNRREARQILTGYKRRFPYLDVDGALDGAIETTTLLDAPLKQSLQFGGPWALRSTVKSALAFAFRQKANMTACASAISYLSGTGTMPNVAAFYSRDLVDNRPAGTLCHIVSVQSDVAERRLVGYVEYFSVTRFIVILSEDYSGPSVSGVYAVDPSTGKEVSLSVDLALSDAEVAAIESDKGAFEGLQDALDRAMPILLKKREERSREFEISKIVDEAFQQSGAEPGAILDEQQTRRVISYVSSEAAKLYVLGKR